jgi:hypothetical protein
LVPAFALASKPVSPTVLIPTHIIAGHNGIESTSAIDGSHSVTVASQPVREREASDTSTGN